MSSLDVRRRRRLALIKARKEVQAARGRAERIRAELRHANAELARATHRATEAKRRTGVLQAEGQEAEAAAASAAARVTELEAALQAIDEGLDSGATTDP